MVYITEAHPSDVWQMQSNIKDKVVFASPHSEEERGLVAGSCVRKLGIEIPAVLDEFGNSTESAYTAWPDRLYVIDSTGRVAYKSKPGPFGFHADELKTAIQKVVTGPRRILEPTQPDFVRLDGQGPALSGVEGAAVPTLQVLLLTKEAAIQIAASPCGLL